MMILREMKAVLLTMNVNKLGNENIQRTLTKNQPIHHKKSFVYLNLKKRKNDENSQWNLQTSLTIVV